MLGTIVNACAIIAGTVIGCLLHKGIKDKYKEMLYAVLGLVSLAIGLNTTISNLGKSHFPIIFILSLSIGSVVGTAFNLDGRFKRLISHYSKQGTNNLSNALSTAILLFCIGPLSMLGPVISALNGDNTFLYTNATLDFVTSIILASTYGIGMILTAPVLFCWQGAFYLVTKISHSAISSELMVELLIVGGIMIVASGLSLLKLKDCKTLNMLPAFLLPIAWFIIKGLCFR